MAQITYYFNPLSQKYSESSATFDKEDPLVTFAIDPLKVSADKLDRIIRLLGNEGAIFEVMETSKETKLNPCRPRYSDHVSTCGQEPLQHCKRHLTEEETKEGTFIYEKLRASIREEKIEATIGSPNILLGDIDLMRKIFKAVRQSVLPTT